MKLSYLLLLLTAALATAADAPSLTGKWQVQQSISGNDSQQDCTFTQTGSDLSGSCTSNRGPVTISGTVTDGKIAWAYKSEYEGTPLTVKYTGKLDATGKISGSVGVDPFGVSGEFTATPIK